MEKKIIATKNAPAAVGPYSQGIKAGNLIFTSGQIPFVPETGKLVSEDIKLQARQSLENVKAVLKEAGATLSDVIKVTVFLKDMNDFGSVNEIYAEFFNESYPARSCVEVARLPKDVAVEIEAIALI